MVPGRRSPSSSTIQTWCATAFRRCWRVVLFERKGHHHFYVPKFSLASIVRDVEASSMTHGSPVRWEYVKNYWRMVHHAVLRRTSATCLAVFLPVLSISVVADEEVGPLWKKMMSTIVLVYDMIGDKIAGMAKWARSNERYNAFSHL